MLFGLFVVFGVYCGIIKMERTNVQKLKKGVKILYANQWAESYLQQAGVLRAYLKRLRAQENLEQERESMLYSMYLECRHTGEFLNRRSRIQTALERERSAKRHGKKNIAVERHDREHIWGATVWLGTTGEYGQGTSPHAGDDASGNAGGIDPAAI